MIIRRFLGGDADETAQVISKTLRISNSLDYPVENIEANINKRWNVMSSFYELKESRYLPQ